MRAAQLVDLSAHELFPSVPVLRDETGVDENLDVLLDRGEADRVQPAELADRALAVERLRDDVAPSCIAEREEQSVRELRALERFYNHLVVDYVIRSQCQAPSPATERVFREAARLSEPRSERGCRASLAVLTRR